MRLISGKIRYLGHGTQRWPFSFHCIKDLLDFNCHSSLYSSHHITQGLENRNKMKNLTIITIHLFARTVSIRLNDFGATPEVQNMMSGLPVSTKTLS